ncbi:MAG: hypothetical protein SF182_25200 [Deltaproteobacteria bacterium]|nr:hypothetical protein [Deltaproteobacteria bacterium]
MSDVPGGDKPEQGPAVKDRWWVDTGDKKKERAAPPQPVSTVGRRFYRTGVGFDQDKARTRLSDNNRRILEEANPADGEWAYLLLADKPHNQQNRERIQAQVTLPPYARGVVVDCGRTLRLLVTGTPPGERILDLTLGDTPSFDCWIEGDWVRERVFRDQRSALGALRRFIPELLSPEGIAAGEAVRARV